MRAARGTAIAVGVLFLTATVSYLAGSVLVDLAISDQDALSDLNTSQLRIGVILQFVNAASVVSIAVLLFPILRAYRERMALGYVGTRIIESAFLLVSAFFALLLVPLSREASRGGGGDAPELRALGTLALEAYDLAFQFALIVLGAGSLLLVYVLYEAKLVPRALPVLGFIGYVALFASGWLEIAGYDVAFLYIPGGLFELAFPVWLIARGFTERQ